MNVCFKKYMQIYTRILLCWCAKTNLFAKFSLQNHIKQAGNIHTV